MLLLFLMLPAMSFTQNTLSGKIYRTKTTESCHKTTTGGYTTTDYRQLEFSATSVTLISYSKASDKELPTINRNIYTYKEMAEKIIINAPTKFVMIKGENKICYDYRYSEDCYYIHL